MTSQNLDPPRMGGYTFWLSRNHPKIWQDRIDLVLLASILVAGCCAVGYWFASNMALELQDRASTIATIPAIFILAGSALCFVTTAFWINTKSRILHLADAPFLSRVSPVFRYSICLLVIWLPLIFAYSALAELVDMLIDSRWSLFSLKYFQEMDPWLSAIALGIVSVILAFILMHERFGATQALTALMIFVVWSIVALFGIILIASTAVDEELMIATMTGGLLILHMVLGAVFRGKGAYARVVFQGGAILSSTLGPWLFFIGVAFPDQISIQSATMAQGFLLAMFLASTGLIAMQWRRFHS